MTRSCLLFLGAFLVGCTSTVEPRDRLAAVTQSVVYHAGDTVVVHLLNLSDETLSYSTCHPTLMREEAAGWVAVTPDTIPCGGVGRLLEAGAADSARVIVASNLPTSIYKMIFEDVSTASGAALRLSERETNPFRILSSGK